MVVRVLSQDNPAKMRETLSISPAKLISEQSYLSPKSLHITELFFQVPLDYTLQTRGYPPLATAHHISPSCQYLSVGMGVNDLDLAHTLADAFNTLADEVQTLADRRTVLEHKLRFAHEQVSKPRQTYLLCLISAFTAPSLHHPRIPTLHDEKL